MPEDAVAYRFEAEDATLSNFQVEKPIRVEKDYASNYSYVGNYAANASVSFTVNSEEATTAFLYAGVAKRSFTIDFSNMFRVTVNGKEIVISNATIPQISNGEEDYHCFISLKLAAIELQEGENIIEITAKQSATNLDYIDVYSTIILK
jgi:hypothetical protein